MTDPLDNQDNQNVHGQRVRPLSQEPLEPIERVVPVLTGQYTDQQPTEGLKLDPEREQPGFGPPGPASFSPIRQGQVPVSQGRVTVEEGDEFEKNKKNRGLLKLLLFLLIIFFLGIGSTVTITRLFADEAYRSKKGVVFSSSGDAEVVLQSWQHWGNECVDHFDGMFAFALYCKGVLHLVTDPFGEKPLYWAKTADGLYFSSEPNPLVNLLNLPANFSARDITAFLSLGFLPGEGLQPTGNNKLLPS